MRLFIGIPMPEAVGERLAGFAGGIPGARWVAAENLHLTLRFLGEVTPPQAEELAVVLASVPASASAGVSIRISGLGLFGDRRRPRLLYADVAPDPALLSLNRKVERAVQNCGHAPEGRKFHPHVTLARFRKPDRSRLDRFLESHKDLSLPPFAADGFTLFRSHLGAEGAVYEPLMDFGGAPETPEDA